MGQFTKGEIVVAKESFSTTLDGQIVTVHKGVTRVRVGHPLLKGHEQFFEPLSVQYDYEQATAAPGEVRGAPPAAAARPAAKAPAKAEKDED